MHACTLQRLFCPQGSVYVSQTARPQCSHRTHQPGELVFFSHFYDGKQAQSNEFRISFKMFTAHCDNPANDLHYGCQ